MPRTSSSNVSSYLSEPELQVRLLARVTFTSTTMRLHTGVGTLTVGATHYDGIGNFGGIDRIAEADGRPAGVKMWLSAVHSASLSEAITESLFNKSVSIYRAWMRDGAVVNTPQLWYKGVMGEVDIHRGDPERGNYIEVGLQTRLDRERSFSYYTKEDHWQVYSGDTFFAYLDQIEGQKALWGQRPTRFSGYRPKREALPSALRVWRGRG